MRRPASPLLFVILSGLVSVNLYLGIRLWRSEPVIAPRIGEDAWNAESHVALTVGKIGKPLAAYGTTLSRPVLFKSRQPYVAPLTPPPKVSEAVVSINVSFRLGGIVITDRIKKAFLYRAGEPKGIWVSEGEKAGGWDVETIDARRTILRQNGRTVELLLYPQR